MIARPGYWHEVFAGGYIKSVDGRLWRVEKLEEKTVELLGTDYKPRTIDRPRNYQQVTIVDVTADEAIAAVQKVLDGTVLEEAAPV